MAAVDPVGAPRRAGFAFMRAHPAHWIALGGGTGLIRPGPGTWATAATWLLFAALRHVYGDLPAVPIGIGIGLLGVGLWAAQRAGKALGRHDAGEIVIDEIAAFWWVLTFLPDAAWGAQLAAFLLFRLFDIAKPVPILRLERVRPDGLAVMLDDLAAGVYTWLAIHLWMRLS